VGSRGHGFGGSQGVKPVANFLKNVIRSKKLEISCNALYLNWKHLVILRVQNSFDDKKVAINDSLNLFSAEVSNGCRQNRVHLTFGRRVL
jgi:hypothetical protein